MNKFIGFFTHNWLLKLISLILAIVLYLSLKDPTAKSSISVGKPAAKSPPVNRSYETMTDAILKALNSAKLKENDTEEKSSPEQKATEPKKVSGQENAK
jgi:hypothetical protein